VNKNFKHLILDIDGIFSKLLLLRKKKYAAIVLDHATQKTKLEMKGLDMVRRDWSLIAKEVGNKVLTHLLNAESIDNVVDEVMNALRDYSSEIKEEKIPI
jgi:DNA polymerase alpha subunit A